MVTAGGQGAEPGERAAPPWGRAERAGAYCAPGERLVFSMRRGGGEGRVQRAFPAPGSLLCLEPEGGGGGAEVPLGLQPLLRCARCAVGALSHFLE